MVHLSSHSGAMLALFCFLIALVAGNPVHLAENKRDTSSIPPLSIPHHSHFGTSTEEHHRLSTKTGSVSHISSVSQDSTHTWKHHHKLTKTGIDANPTSHHEHTRTESHKSHETEHSTSLGHETSSLKTPGHYTVEKREVSEIVTLAGSTAEASHDIPHPSHGPHIATHLSHGSHTPHSTHKEHSTGKELSHTSAMVHLTNTQQTPISTTPTVHTTEAARVSDIWPWWGTRTQPETFVFTSPSRVTITIPGYATHPPVHNPADLEARRHKSSSKYTFNPTTLQNATTIALPSTTYCITSLYLPHSPTFGPGTKTVWTSTATLYPEWDCHGCESLTMIDPWTMGQPTTHYHHTKTSKSVISVVSPVCKATQTGIAVTLTAA